jgi:hypothetical protein
MSVFWVVAPCSLVEVYQRFGGPASIIRAMSRPDDGGSKDLRNVGKLLPDYTAQQPRRQTSSIHVLYAFTRMTLTGNRVIHEGWGKGVGKYAEIRIHLGYSSTIATSLQAGGNARSIALLPGEKHSLFC